MTLDEQRDWRAHPKWLAKVGQAARKAAADVAAESAATDHHALRAALALLVLTDPGDTWERAFTQNVAAQPAVTAEPSDNDLAFTVGALWNAMAGAPGPA
jgi:hypothetical protein